MSVRNACKKIKKKPPRIKAMHSEGILLINKPKNMTSFSVVAKMRKIFQVKTIGHAGTLDPFATGVLVILIGRNFTRLQDQFLVQDKEYRAVITLGTATDTYDRDGKILATSTKVPIRQELDAVLVTFQGKIEQVPPMFSAKKVNGQRLYDLARRGKTIERKSNIVTVSTECLRYEYPEIEIHVVASKGTYIRSLAVDIGRSLGVEAHVSSLERLRSGPFLMKDCIRLEDVTSATPLLSSVP